jgi:adenine-specific DNA-methyltransferase
VSGAIFCASHYNRSVSVPTKSKRVSGPAAGSKNSGQANSAGQTKTYSYPTETAPLRPDIGTQPQFRKRKQPTKYSYDSSLSPALDWDGQNAARERGERLIREILEAPSLEHARDAARQLQQLSRPFLNWAGKAERLSFDVPSLPLFVHERISTSAILETLRSHRHDAGQMSMFDLFGDPQRSVTDQILKPYEHGPWQNRMIMGDSLVVMNSLLQYEGMGGKIQMIYIDPPYGVKFGSNFQPFVRKRDVSHGDDEDMTREPETVQAYRDTWELGLHSYLTYLRDRLKIARELLKPDGSVFVQISDENVHHVRQVMDEVFGDANFVSEIVFSKTTGFSGNTLSSIADWIIWYARDAKKLEKKSHPLFRLKQAGEEGASKYKPISSYRSVPPGRFHPDRLATIDQLTSQGKSGERDDTFEFKAAVSSHLPECIGKPL